MKDYHDLLLMIRKPSFLDVGKLAKVIQGTFSRRGTATKLFIEFDQDGQQGLQVLWNNHLRGLGVFRERLNLPDKISGAINEINAWVISSGL